MVASEEEVLKVCELLSTQPFEWEIRMRELSMLKRGWDGIDAEPINTDILSLLSELLQLLEWSSPEIRGVPDGTVDLNWKERGIYCTFTENEIIMRYFPTGGQLHQYQEDSWKYSVVIKHIQRIKNQISA